MTRVVSGAVMVVLVIAIVWFAPPPAFAVFAGVVAIAACAELRRLVPFTAAVPLGVVYVALPLAALIALRIQCGPEAVFLLMLTIMVSDTAQYYTGRALGRRPLAPRISPKKTIEGALGGFVVATATFVIVGAWWAPTIPPGARVALGLALVALGIAGDLFESFLKRRAGVKDSSHLIPGHGGVLDRIDALLFAAPAYYAALKVIAAS